MLKEKEDFIRKAMVVFDGFVVSVAFALSYILRQRFHEFYTLDLIPSSRVVASLTGTLNDYIVALVLVVPIWCVVLYLNGMYRSLRTATILNTVWIIIKTALLTTIAFGAFVFLFKLHFVSRVFFIMFMAISFSFVLLEKVAIVSIAHYVRRQGYNFKRILIVGTGARALSFMTKIKSHSEWGIRVEGIVDDEPEREGKAVSDTDILGSLDLLQDILHMKSIDEVVFIVPRARLDNLEKYIYICETEGVRATIAVDLFDLKIGKARQTELDGVPLITFETTPSREWQLFMKRALDIVASGAGLIVLAPLFIVTAFLIKITSRGPVFFRQKRVGVNGRRFTLYKFRTMQEDAMRRQAEIEKLNIMTGPVFKVKNDPRITTLGKFLRKFSIDELPQLYNVFAGHMSLVGPRPPLPKEVAQYKPWQRRRLSLRPGLTCIWQISGRNEIGFDEWMKLDLEYIDNWSLWLDFKILIKTIPVVLFGSGAY